MGDVATSELQKAIRHNFGCDSTFVDAVFVLETWERQTAWQGIVRVFELVGHPTAERCYAWSHAVDGSERRRFVTVLHGGAIDSAQAAVRAALVQEFRETKGK